MGMEKRREPGDSVKSPGRMMGRAAVVLLALALLTGCSRERMETRREIARIKKAAESVAEDRAAAHILEKYGIEALAEGYWVQAYDDFFAPNVNSNVVVFLEHGDRKFCVGIDVDDETVLWDNYQRAEIDSALQGYLRELYGLSPAYRAETVFRLEDAPNYSVATPSEWREKGYDHANMVDFLFQGQPAEELLARMAYLEFHDAWLSAEPSLEGIAFDPADWPLCEGGYLEWNLRLYASPEAAFVDLSTGYPDVGGFPYFREWGRICFRDKGTEGQEMSHEFFAFQSLETGGITVTSRSPRKIEDIIVIKEGETQWETSQGQTYRLGSDVFEVTENAGDSYYATTIHVPAEFAAQYEGELFILSRRIEAGQIMEGEQTMEGVRFMEGERSTEAGQAMEGLQSMKGEHSTEGEQTMEGVQSMEGERSTEAEQAMEGVQSMEGERSTEAGQTTEEPHPTKTGEVRIVKQILSQEELDALPGDAPRRDYQIYSNGTCGMSAGYQYAVAVRQGKQ